MKGENLPSDKYRMFDDFQAMMEKKIQQNDDDYNIVGRPRSFRKHPVLTIVWWAGRIPIFIYVFTIGLAINFIRDLLKMNNDSYGPPD